MPQQAGDNTFADMDDEAVALNAAIAAAAGGNSTSAVGSNTNDTANNEIASCCYICLEEGPDEYGEELARDCSCRGGASRYHIRCIIAYAERKSREWDQTKNPSIYIQPWTDCPNCKQEYQSDLKLKMADALISFTERQYPCHPRVQHLGVPCDPYMFAKCLLVKTDAYDHLAGRLDYTFEEIVKYRAESKKLSLQVISIVDKMKMHYATYGGSSLPVRFVQVEAMAYNNLGLIYGVEGAYKSAVICFEKSKDLAESYGDKAFVESIEDLITQTKGWGEVGSDERKLSVQALRQKYKQNPEEHGITFVTALEGEKRFIERQRTLAVMVSRSQRIRGRDHDETKSLEIYMKVAQARRAIFLPEGNGKELYVNGEVVNEYLVLRCHEGNSQKYTIRGPWQNLCEPNKDIKSFVVNFSELCLEGGTPVICHGLINSHHLNGKIGDARKWNKKAGSYEVYFEDTSLKACLVKPKNLKVLFDLPAKE